jgi:C_GCAxxG_C_C family probable redox protein
VAFEKGDAYLGKETSTSERAAERALELFDAGLNCAESTLQALAEHWGLADHMAVPGVAACFGGGIGRSGGVCGGLTGALMALGLRQGRREPSDMGAKEEMYQIAAAVQERFETLFGTASCREITGVDMKTEEGHRVARDAQVHARICRGCVRAGVMAALQVADVDRPGQQPD